jgi:glycosyltransferase involved in cell wall biosynthesis/predicted SAM-dependent methyltransferase/Tfp pilus assembly protein PilF
MRAALAAHGVDADIAREEEPDPRGYDLVHVFNVWEPAAARRQLEHLRNTGVPVVFSPILLGLEETLWMQHAMLPAFARQATDEALAAELARLERTPAAVREAFGRSVSAFWQEWPARVRELTALADHLVVLSEGELERLQRLGALIPSFSLVHNGVEPGWADGVDADLFARRFGVRDYVLSVGRLEPRKNQLLLARALRDTGIDLVLVGDTPKPDYAELVRRHGGPRTHLIGRLDHGDPLLRSAFAGARVFALPSWAEGAPLAALEAAALGIPLVLSNRSGEREYFGPLAAYCDPGSVDDIRDKVQAAFEGAAQAAGHRAALRQWVMRSLTWDHAALETARAYAAALEAAARRRGAAPPAFAPPPPRRLEIGSGHNPQPGYEHLDARADLPDIDHVCDIRQPLPFPAATFDEVLSRSCLEHVSWREVRHVLAEWARILKPGGRIDLWSPDLEYLCRRYLARRDDRHLDLALAGEAVEALGGFDSSSWAIVKLFGGQDYPENFHGAVLDEEVLSRLLEAAGFVHVERREPFWGLHLVARRAPAFMRPPTRTAASTRSRPPAPDEPITTLVWDAPLFNTSGYAALSRHVVRALVASGLSVRAEPRDDDEVMRRACVDSPVEGAVWRRVLRRRGRPGAYVCCYTPADWQGRSLFHQRRNEHPGFQAYVGLTMFETDRLPAGWVEACAAFDEIWVPSRFNLESFARAGVPAGRLQVVPVGIDASRYDPARVEPLDLPGRRGFTFLSVFDWSRRKGWDVLLEAYGRAFRASDDVCLVLRTSDRRARPGALASAVSAAFERLGIPAGARPAVLLLEEPLPEDDMPRLYRAADAFVLPTRGEGWGLPLMEAMAAGLPVIATRWGAHLDFLTDDTGFLIDVEAVVPVDPDQTGRSPYYGADHRWAQPSVDHTAALMRQVYERPEAARQVGGRAREAIRTSWTPARTAAWIAERLERLAPDAAGFVDRARAAEAAGRLDEAEALYRRAVSIRPEWVLVARYNLASALERQGRHAEARTLFEAIAGHGGDPGLRSGACFHLGRLAFQAGDLDGAMRWFERCLADNPAHRHATAWRALVDGRRHEAAGRLVEALAGYEAACQVDPAWSLAAYNLASAAKRLGDRERAVERFTRLAREADASSLRGGAHFHLAEMLAEAGDFDGALARIESCLLEIPGHGAARALAARLAPADRPAPGHRAEPAPSHREA